MDGRGDREIDASSADADGGTYTLLIELTVPASVEIGALGERAFEAGWYAYTGSAFGPGGFARIDRHREIASGERHVRHWHVDYLLGHPDASIDAVWTTRGSDRECAVAAALHDEVVAGFGASDCDCASHLAGATDRSALVEPLDALHARRAPDLGA